MSGQKTGRTEHAGSEKAAVPDMLTPVATLGAVTSIMLASPMHRHVFLTELEWLIVPAIGLRQIRIFHHETVPVAFATWALLNDEVAARFRQGQGRLKPEEWHCGDELWLVELCAPYGGVKALLDDLVTSTFGGRTVNTIRPAADGAGFEISTLEQLAKEAA